MISLSSITGFLLYVCVCVLALLKFIGQFFICFITQCHDVNRRALTAACRKQGCFFGGNILGCLLVPEHCDDFRPLCFQWRHCVVDLFFSFAVTFSQPDGVNRCQMALRCVSVSRVTHAYTHSISLGESQVAKIA